MTSDPGVTLVSSAEGRHGPIQQVRNFFRKLFSPGPVMTYEPSAEQKVEITEAIRKQRFYGDLPGRREYQDKEYRGS